MDISKTGRNSYSNDSAYAKHSRAFERFGSIPLPFKDVEQASPWAKAVILEAQEKKFMSGDPKGYFHPLQQVTRQEAAVSLAKLMGLELNDHATSKFSDVTPSSWSASAIEAVQKPDG